jgi:hypothetical protein
MKQYKVLCTSLVGKHNKTYKKDAVISEDCLHAGAADELVAAKLIAEVLPEKEADTSKKGTK